MFIDRPKADAAPSLARLARLGIVVKVITGDSPQVAVKVCHDLGLDVLGALTGDQVDAMDDDALGAAIDRTTVFARVGPETKARIVRVQRVRGADVAFMGDGVNDAVALHHADVGISVDTGTDVAKDAADIILLDKDLGVLADGVVEGRRIFANTIKYVLMATSSNFGNMFSAAGASAFLSFLPMLPSQILLNNLLYDAQPDDDPDRQRRRGDAGASVGVGHRVHPQLHDVLRAAQLDLRLRDVRRDDRRAARARAGVPHRLVRRVARDADARDLRDPDAAASVLAQPAEPAAPDRVADRAAWSASCCRTCRSVTRSASRTCRSSTTRSSARWWWRTSCSSSRRRASSTGGAPIGAPVAVPRVAPRTAHPSPRGARFTHRRPASRSVRPPGADRRRRREDDRPGPALR